MHLCTSPHFLSSRLAANPYHFSHVFLWSTAWAELVVLLRKVAIVAIFMFVSAPDRAPLMVMLIIVVLAISLAAQLIAQPYAEKRHNRIEVRSL